VKWFSDATAADLAEERRRALEPANLNICAPRERGVGVSIVVCRFRRFADGGRDLTGEDARVSPTAGGVEFR
jgi:hypothetical protein